MIGYLIMKEFLYMFRRFDTIMRRDRQTCIQKDGILIVISCSASRLCDLVQAFVERAFSTFDQAHGRLLPNSPGRMILQTNLQYDCPVLS